MYMYKLELADTFSQSLRESGGGGHEENIYY